MKKRKDIPLTIDKIDWSKTENIFAVDKRLLLESYERAEKPIPYAKDLLKLLAAGTIIGLSLVMPALPMAIAPFVMDGKKYRSDRYHQICRRLKKQKLVEIIEIDGQTLVKITREGRTRALKYKIDELQVKKPKNWDKKWRIVIFDIPEKAKRMRDIFRTRLKLLGFYNLQESVWVHPYPCFDQVEFLREIYRVGGGVKYIVADKIEEDEDLMHFFKLN